MIWVKSLHMTGNVIPICCCDTFDNDDNVVMLEQITPTLQITLNTLCRVPPEGADLN